MNELERQFWEEVVILLKKERYQHISKTYSSKDGWANLCYRTGPVHITYQNSWYEIVDLLDNQMKKYNG